MRLLILMGLVYLCYRVLKSWMLKGTSPRETAFGKKRNEIDDVMVKDPYCEIYFAKRDGVRLNVDGKDEYFCSNECKEKYLERQTKG